MELDPQHWRRLSELLDTALDMNEREQAAWLDELAKRGTPLIEPLRKMLAQRARFETNDVLAVPPDFTAAFGLNNTAKNVSLELKPDALIGAYKLERELGRGGMAAVWLAQRVDGKLNRQVALKFPYAGPAQQQLIERLNREREILATLEHPNIARLYDADVTSSGQPFLVLEYVVGESINEYCKRHALPLKKRIELFLQVLGAVQFAHTRLVIHRDLKPSNILVDAQGAPRLLDFGIAKLISESGGNESVLTRFGGQALTPDFASPEQIGGATVTTASDVYALGVILFELLTQTRPYKLKRDSRAALEESIANAEVIAPSRAAPKDHAAELRGDLDTIVLKALSKNPQDRYATADAFALDLKRFLESKPIEARPDSLWYRFQKFSRRNRLAMTASTVIALSLIVGTGIALWQYSIAKENERKAIAEARTADAAKRFMIEIFQTNTLAQADPAKARQKTALELLEAGAERVEAEFKDNPTLQRELLTVIVRMLGESRSPNYEKWAAKLAALWQSAEGGTVKAAELNRELVMLAQHRSLDESEALAHRALDQLGSAKNSEERKVRAGLLQTLGNTLSVKSKFAEAKVALNEASDLLKDEFSNTTEYGYTLRDLGGIELQLGNNDQALSYLSAAQKAFEGDPTTLPRTFGFIYHDVGLAYFGQKNYVAAERQYRMSLDSMTKAYGPDDQQSARQAVDVARALTAQRRFDEALAMLQPALKVLEKDSPNFDARYLRVARQAWMMTLVASGRLKEAEPVLKELLAGIDGEIPILAVRAFDAAAEYYAERGKADEVRTYHERLNRAMEKLGADSARGREYRLLNAKRLIDVGETKAGEQLLADLSASQKMSDPDAAELRDAIALQKARLNTTETSAAVATLNELWQHQLAKPSERRDLGDELDIRSALGAALMKAGRYQEAKPHIERVLELRRSEYAQSPTLAQAQRALADCLRKLEHR